MPGLTVLLQTNQDTLKVFGVAYDSAWPEPTTIESVEVQILGTGPGVNAVLSTARRDGRLLVRNFSAEMQRPSTQGTHVVVVTARNEHGISVTKRISYPGLDVAPPPPLSSALAGTALITTNRNFPGEPYGSAVIWGLQFDGFRTQVVVTSMVPWNVDTTAAAPKQFGFLFGPNFTSFILVGHGSGHYDKTTRAMDVDLMLHVHHSRELLFIPEDSDLSIHLSTTAGAPVTGAGLVTLSGSAPFVGGWLGGNVCTISVTGTLTPAP